MIDLGQIQLELSEGLTPEQEALKREYIESMISNPFPQVHYGPQYIPVHCSLNEFISFLTDAINEDQKDSRSKIILIDAFTKINMFENPSQNGEDVRGAIAYRLLKQTPGSVAQSNNPFSTERRETRPRLRAITKGDPDRLGEVVFHFGQFFDNLIQFTIYAKSNKEANDIVDWFENIIEKNRQFFAYCGIIGYYFLERDSDTIIREGDGVVHIRPLSYWVRTEKTFETTEQAVNNIIVKIKTT